MKSVPYQAQLLFRYKTGSTLCSLTCEELAVWTRLILEPPSAFRGLGLQAVTYCQVCLFKKKTLVLSGWRVCCVSHQLPRPVQ